MPLSNRFAWVTLLCAALLAGGCAGLKPPASNSQAVIEAWAADNGYRAVTIPSSPYRLFSLLRQRRQSDELVIYIEGDGTGRPSPFRPFEPTPRTPHALRMADRDASPMVAYLARPCEYLSDANLPACDSQHWVTERYSADVLDAMAAGVDDLKRRSGAARLRLVGYAGGGVVATMLAVNRDDVSAVITVASPLALAQWLARNRLGWINPALDPFEQRSLAGQMPTVHFIGGRDDIVSPEFPVNYVHKLGGTLIYIEDFDHECCWANDWPWLLEQAHGEQSAP